MTESTSNNKSKGKRVAGITASLKHPSRSYKHQSLIAYATPSLDLPYFVDVAHPFLLTACILDRRPG